MTLEQFLADLPRACWVTVWCGGSIVSGGRDAVRSRCKNILSALISQEQWISEGKEVQVVI